MSAAPGVDARPPLVRLYHGWIGLLSRHAPPGVAPLLRLEQGAGLVRGARVETVAGLMDPMLALAAPRLYLPPSSVAGATLRPKLRIALRAGGAGLAAQLRYFGAAPGDPQLRAAFAHLGARACPLPPLVRGDGAHAAGAVAGLAAGEVCLRVCWDEGRRPLPLVRVMAGRRPVALPMLAVARAVSEDRLERALPRTRSLAQSLHEEPTPAEQGRPAVLLLRSHAGPVALRVEALLGHGVEQVLPAGPLLQGLPWLLGVVDDDGGPTLVVDPLALPGLAEPMDEPT